MTGGRRVRRAPEPGWRARTDFVRRVGKQGVRVFHPVETARISRDALGMLLRLTNSGVISPSVREEAMNAAMWLDQCEVTSGEMDQIVRFLLDRSPTPAPRSDFIPLGPAHEADLDPKRWN